MFQRQEEELIEILSNLMDGTQAKPKLGRGYMRCARAGQEGVALASAISTVFLLSL